MILEFRIFAPGSARQAFSVGRNKNELVSSDQIIAAEVVVLPAYLAFDIEFPSAAFVWPMPFFGEFQFIVFAAFHARAEVVALDFSAFRALHVSIAVTPFGQRPTRRR
jgi:hypothetical protein